MGINYLSAINYLLVAGLLLAISGFVFAVFNKKLSLLQNKLLIHFLLITALLLPCCLPHISHYAEGLDDAQTFDYHRYNDWNVVNINDPALVACYEKTKNSRDFCQCEIVQKARLWEYRPDTWRDKIIAAWPVFLVIILAAFCFFAIKLLWQWAALLWLIARSRRKNMVFRGQIFCVVYAAQGYEAACFNGLGTNYLFWSALLDELPQAEKEQILAHELAHLAQKDGWALLFWRAAQTIFWSNPAFYYLKRQLLAINEFCADAAVLKQKTDEKNYARLLLKLKLSENSKPKTQPLKLFFAKSLLHSRINRILQYQEKQSQNNSFSWRFWRLIGGIFAFFWLVAQPTQAYLESENIAIHQYEILKTASQKTGLTHICVDCVAQK